MYHMLKHDVAMGPKMAHKSLDPHVRNHRWILDDVISEPSPPPKFGITMELGAPGIHCHPLPRYWHLQPAILERWSQDVLVRNRGVEDDSSSKWLGCANPMVQENRLLYESLFFHISFDHQWLPVGKGRTIIPMDNTTCVEWLENGFSRKMYRKTMENHGCSLIFYGKTMEQLDKISVSAFDSPLKPGQWLNFCNGTMTCSLSKAMPESLAKWDHIHWMIPSSTIIHAMVHQCAYVYM